MLSLAGRTQLFLRAAIFLLLTTCWLVCFANTLNEPVNRDEHMYLAAAALSTEHRIYRDFAFLQTPYSVPVYLAANRLAPTQGVLLGARLLKSAVTAATLLVMFLLLQRVGAPPLMAAILVTLLFQSALVRDMAGLARNYDLAQLALFAGLCALPLRPAERGPAWRWTVAGCCAALAVGFKLIQAPAALLILVWPLVVGGAARRRSTGLVLAGAAAGTLPFLWMVRGIDPATLRFNLLDYHFLNAELHALEGYEPHASLVDRAKQGWTLLSSLGHWPLMGIMLLGIGLGSGPWQRFRGPDKDALRLVLVWGFLGAALLAAVIPRPPQKYYFAPVLFGLTLVAGAHVGRLNRRGVRALTALCLVAAGLGVAQRAPELRNFLDAAARPQSWPARQIHEDGRLLASVAPPGTPVATTHPLYALEAGRELYPELAAAEFAWRLGDLLEPAKRRRLRIASAGDLEELLERRPPGAVVVERDAPWDGPLRQWAADRGWQAVPVARPGLLIFVP